jgi:hypothetical protein
MIIEHIKLHCCRTPSSDTCQPARESRQYVRVRLPGEEISVDNDMISDTRSVATTCTTNKMIDEPGIWTSKGRLLEVYDKMPH